MTLKQIMHEMLAEKNLEGAITALNYASPDAIVEYLRTLEPNQRAQVFRWLDKPRTRDVFETLEPTEQLQLARALEAREIASLLDALSPDTRTRLMDELPAKMVRRILQVQSHEECETGQKLTAGSEAAPDTQPKNPTDRSEGYFGLVWNADLTLQDDTDAARARREAIARARANRPHTAQLEREVIVAVVVLYLLILGSFAGLHLYGRFYVSPPEQQEAAQPAENAPVADRQGGER